MHAYSKCVASQYKINCAPLTFYLLYFILLNAYYVLDTLQCLPTERLSDFHYFTFELWLLSLVGN